MTIAKIISGGQTGVDIAALRAAKRAGIPTGGTMPRGFPVRRFRGELVTDEERIWAIAERLKDLASELQRDIVANFAGNSEETAPGIEAYVEDLVRRLIEATRA